VLLITLLAATAVASNTHKFETVLWMAPEKSDTSQFFIISPESPVLGMASPLTEFEAIVFLASTSR
jgi:hypothetical protein